MRTRGTIRLSGIAAAALLAAGCAGTPVRESAPSEPRPEVEPQTAVSETGAPIAALALSLVGVKYRYGGARPDQGFDCSGLVHYAYTSHGYFVPRTSRAQLGAARRIPLADAAPGDLVFFQDQDDLSHVGIYLGGGRFVHAPSSGGAVRVAHIEAPYYQRHFVAAGRLLPR